MFKRFWYWLFFWRDQSKIAPSWPKPSYKQLFTVYERASKVSTLIGRGMIYKMPSLDAVQDLANAIAEVERPS